MQLEEVKKNLNEMVVYKGKKGIYQLVACVLRKKQNQYIHSAVLLDTKNGNSVLTCSLSEIEVEE